MNQPLKLDGMQEFTKISVKVPQSYLDLINNVFEIERKVSQIKEDNSISRNVNKLKDLIQSELFNRGIDATIGFTIHNPIGESYNETRTDCEASIAGTGTENLEIIEVIKPIIFYTHSEGGKITKSIAQKAVVVVKSRK